jgi:hypothetical protein
MRSQHLTRGTRAHIPLLSTVPDSTRGFGPALLKQPPRGEALAGARLLKHEVRLEMALWIFAQCRELQ